MLPKMMVLVVPAAKDTPVMPVAVPKVARPVPLTVPEMVVL